MQQSCSKTCMTVWNHLVCYSMPKVVLHCPSRHLYSKHGKCIYSNLLSPRAVRLVQHRLILAQYYIFFLDSDGTHPQIPSPIMSNNILHCIQFILNNSHYNFSCSCWSCQYPQVLLHQTHWWLTFENVILLCLPFRKFRRLNFWDQMQALFHNMFCTFQWFISMLVLEEPTSRSFLVKTVWESSVY